ncbi:hypothetical protein [Clostridium lundense]|uniref:hypothetical protein n=1 Tax=Clostridium lundense TaxID=319475 RepID=UPI0012EB9A2A|nr:hypothetical protein [Clostridium lundense]
MHEIFSFEDALQFLDDGKNIESKLHLFKNWYIDEVNGLFGITKIFFDLCEKI